MLSQSRLAPATAERVVQAAGQLARQTGSLQLVSVDQIAAAAGVAKATLYRHFTSKAALSAELVRRGLARAEPVDSRRDQILDAALRVFPRAGLRATTVEQVAHEAGVSQATIYWHFGSKEELIAETFRRFAPSDLVEQLARVPDDAPPGLVLRELARGIARRLQQHGAVLRLIITEVGLYPELADIVFERVTGPIWQRVAGYMARQVELGRFRAGDPMVRTFCVAGPLVATLLARESFGVRISVTLEQVADETIENFLRAVSLSPPGDATP